MTYSKGSLLIPTKKATLTIPLGDLLKNHTVLEKNLHRINILDIVFEDLPKKTLETVYKLFYISPLLNSKLLENKLILTNFPFCILPNDIWHCVRSDKKLQKCSCLAKKDCPGISARSIKKLYYFRDKYMCFPFVNEKKKLFPIKRWYSRYFGETSDILKDLIAVAFDHKPIAVRNYNDIDLNNALKALNKAGRSVKIKIRTSKKHSAIYIYKKDPCFRDLYKLFKNKDSTADHNSSQSGKLLGYPKCCVSNLRKIHNGRSNSYSLVNNFFYLGATSNLSLLSHVPCNLACSASKKLAKNILNSIKLIDIGYYYYLKQTLSWPILVLEKADNKYILALNGSPKYFKNKQLMLLSKNKALIGTVSSVLANKNAIKKSRLFVFKEHL
ncbi:hypothetical protein ACFL5G_04360 [Candidatus Margulisiibacteriota bacterium]